MGRQGKEVLPDGGKRKNQYLNFYVSIPVNTKYLLFKYSWQYSVALVSSRVFGHFTKANTFFSCYCSPFTVSCICQPPHSLLADTSNIQASQTGPCPASQRRSCPAFLEHFTASGHLCHVPHQSEDMSQFSVLGNKMSPPLNSFISS